MTNLNVDIGKGLAFDIDPSLIEAHDNVKAHVLYIGLRNILMDSHASAKRDDFASELEWRDASKAMAEKKLAAMLAGEIRANSSGPRVSKADPIQAEALRLARVAVHGAVKNNEKIIATWTKKFGIVGAPGENIDKIVTIEAIKRFAAKPETIATATANVAAKQALIVEDDLGL